MVKEKTTTETDRKAEKEMTKKRRTLGILEKQKGHEEERENEDTRRCRGRPGAHLTLVAKRFVRKSRMADASPKDMTCK